MDINDENKPASFEDLTGVSEEQMKEWDRLIAERERRDEIINLVPRNDGGEAYISDRYPIAALYARAEIQEIAWNDFETTLTEEEIQEVKCAFIDDYPHEIHVAIVDAIESVLGRRGETKVVDKRS